MMRARGRRQDSLAQSEADNREVWCNEVENRAEKGEKTAPMVVFLVNSEVLDDITDMLMTSLMVWVWMTK